jgi:hypothetical protein
MMLTSVVFTRDSAEYSVVSGDQHHAVGVQDRLHQVLLGLGLEPELGQVESQVALVEDSEHDLLAVQHRQGADAEVDDPVPHLELEPAVLRHAPLGDVELRENLDTRRERGFHLERRAHDLEQRTVHPVAHSDFVLERLDVDVAGAPLHRVDQETVDQLDDRRVFDLRLGDRLLFLLLDDLDVFAGGLHVLEERLQLLLAVGVVLLDQRAEGVFAREHREQVEPGDELEVFQQAEIGGIGHGDREGASLALERQDDALRGHVGRHQLEDPRIHLEAGEIHGRHPVLPGQHLGDLQLGDHAELRQDVAQAMLGGLLLGFRRDELFARDESLAQQHLTELFAVIAGSCGRHGLVARG